MAASVGEWPYLDDADRARLTRDVEVLLATKGWEAAHGFTLTDAMCTVIAAQAALMLLGLEGDVFRHVRAVIVHPTTMTVTAPYPGPAPGLMTEEPVDLVGVAHEYRGPILLAWDAVRHDIRHPGRGSNVVIHEFAHKLDMLDGAVDGAPPLAGVARQRWAAVCTSEYKALRAGSGDPLLRDYAATSPGEFFAVCTEVFFARPSELAETKPALYGVFSGYFGQDPAARRALMQSPRIAGGPT